MDDLKERLRSPALVFLTDTPASASILAKLGEDAAARITALEAIVAQFQQDNPPLTNAALRAENARLKADKVGLVEQRSALAIGDRVEKIKGSCWTGKVVGFYRTELTPYGVCVESEREPGSVQIYPEAALKIMWCDENPRAALEQHGGGK